MNVKIVGAFPKYDFILTTAVLLHAYTEKSVEVVFDNRTAYRFFDNELNGVKLSEGQAIGAEVVLYDFENSIGEKINGPTYLATNFEKAAVQATQDFLGLLESEPAGLILAEVDCQIDEKYIQSLLPFEIPVLSYMEDRARQIEMVHNCVVPFQAESNFKRAVNRFLIQAFEVPKSDLKKLWTYAKKRG